MAINPAKFQIGNVMAKAAGLAGAAMVISDSHSAAKAHSNMYSKKMSTQNIENRYLDTLTLSSHSPIRDSVKKKILFWEVDNDIDKVYYSITGYIKGFADMALNKVVPFALSAGALLTKGAVSKTCGLGLVTYGLGILTRDFFRIGK